MATIRKRNSKRKPKIPFGVLYVIWEYFRRGDYYQAVYVGQAKHGVSSHITIDKNGKLYASGRISGHKKAARNGGGGEIDQHMGKVGLDNFYFETLQIPYRNQSTLNEAERKGIEEDYETFHPNGFNMKSGGQSGTGKVSEASRKKMSVSGTEREANMTPEAKEARDRKCSESATKAHADMSPEAKKAMRKKCSEIATKANANMSPEAKKAKSKKCSEIATERYANQTEEERIAAGKKSGAGNAGKIRNPNSKRKRVYCKKEGCDKQRIRKKGNPGYCWEHYEEKVNNTPELAAQFPPCKEPGCGKRGIRQEFCKYHHGREYRENRPPAEKEREKERDRKNRKNRTPAEKERKRELRRERDRKNRKNRTPAEKERKRELRRERRRKRREEQKASK